MRADKANKIFDAYQLLKGYGFFSEKDGERMERRIDKAIKIRRNPDGQIIDRGYLEN